jgi:hypothetical protein
MDYNAHSVMAEDYILASREYGSSGSCTGAY